MSVTEKSLAKTSKQDTSSVTNSFATPKIELPKGGGAIRGIGEKFAANPVTGTASFTIPLALAKGRANFGPDLSLSYDSGAGNGSFGFGWHLSLPSISRKTDKGLPRYLDAEDNEESDVFILSNAEDLVPIYQLDAQGRIVKNEHGKPTLEEHLINGYQIFYYRPRVEGLFAQIERWIHIETKDVHWRTISRDNILSIYGLNENSRVLDPNSKNRIFSWLITEVRDNKGNAILYRYKAEDAIGVDLRQAHEYNRGGEKSILRKASRYLKHIYYGNKIPLLNTEGKRPRFLSEQELKQADWMFEVVFDYGEHSKDKPLPDDQGDWSCREDPFSSYRAGFELRYYRLCQRVLLFHHFALEEALGKNCLVRSTDFSYHNSNVASFIVSVQQSSYQRTSDQSHYIKKSLPALEFKYSEVNINSKLENIPLDSLENLPEGIQKQYQWLDLEGEGLSGIFSEEAQSWFYKPNRSANNIVIDEQTGEKSCKARFAATKRLQTRTNLAVSAGQWLDLAGDGKTDLAFFEPEYFGYYERNNENWQSFQTFQAYPNINLRDPNIKFIDLTGDGQADLFISEDEAFIWHACLGKEGFGPAQRVLKMLDEEKGPRHLFSDSQQAIFLADFSGDGLTDVVRIRNGEVCYWPNLGYGCFGQKISMDNAPWFDAPDLFDHNRIRLADIDGSGTTDILYLKHNSIQIYLNQAGNTWSRAEALEQVPPIHNESSVQVLDLLGNGTASLVFSNDFPSNQANILQYIDLMAGQKPHLLINIQNNLGAETILEYKPSTFFYLEDKEAGSPWITRLPFPVQVLEKVTHYDHISRNIFTSRYAYHHGYFDGEEREFRGFAFVEQWDSEIYGTHSSTSEFSISNLDKSFTVPRVLTKTWNHTGAYLEGETISNFFANAGNRRDGFYNWPSLSLEDNKSWLLADTILPDRLLLSEGSKVPYSLSKAEEREAHRALKGSILRKEIYALDDTEDAIHPYQVIESNYTIEILQPRLPNNNKSNAVFFTHPREKVQFQYERKCYEIQISPNTVGKIPDPRINHEFILAVDNFANVLKSVNIVYGRHHDKVKNLDTLLEGLERSTLAVLDEKQKQLQIIYNESSYTHSIQDHKNSDYRTPSLCMSRNFELLSFEQNKRQDFMNKLFSFNSIENLIHNISSDFYSVPYEDFKASLGTRMNERGEPYNGPWKRIIEEQRTYYRKDDLSGRLDLGLIESMALPHDSYKLALTPGILNFYEGKVNAGLLTEEGGYVDLDNNGYAWLPTGQIFYSEKETTDTELAFARRHFFLPRRFQDPFGAISYIRYDDYDLLILETEDSLQNRVTAGERDSLGNITKLGNDYRVLQPKLLMDANRNRSAVAFDTLGMVVATAIMGKPGENLGDSLEGLEIEFREISLLAHLDNPLQNADLLLKQASTRLIYDVYAYQRSRNENGDAKPNVVYTLTKDKHAFPETLNQSTHIQQSFSYSDGFGREIQNKIFTGSGKVTEEGPLIENRWLGSGWKIFNNKGNPVQQYEPFFSDTHHFESAKQIGVCATLFYDPLDRVIVTLHPNATYEKVIFDPWFQCNYDVNDTVLLDPRRDLDIKGYTQKYFASINSNWKTWLQERISDPSIMTRDTLGDNPEQDVALRTVKHANTPAIGFFDSMGRIFLTLVHNGSNSSDKPLLYSTRTEIDIEGNERAIIDALQRSVMQYEYNMLGHKIKQISQEAGTRWLLNDVTGKPIRKWDERGHEFIYYYDSLRRPIENWVKGGDGDTPLNHLYEKILYGENQTLNNSGDTTINCRGKPFAYYDGAGKIQFEAYDFKGNLTKSHRRLAKEYKSYVHWGHLDDDVYLEKDSFHNQKEYNALNRVVWIKNGISNVERENTKLNTIYFEYNLLNLLNKVQVNQQDVFETFVQQIDYNEKAQRKKIIYGNGVSTDYQYDKKTFQLIHLESQKKNREILQDLYYTYDPVGNVSQIEDKARPRIFFNNMETKPVNCYEYDPLYRLIKANGREHLAQIHFDPVDNWQDVAFIKKYNVGDALPWQNYSQEYHYDPVGNIETMEHKAELLSWKREYHYESNNNRLRDTTIAGNRFPYTYHPKHGFITSMPHLQIMNWNFKDELCQVSKQKRTSGSPETTYYVYDASGQRVRKITENAANENETPTRKEERIYVEGFEFYRKHSGELAGLERETLKIMDDKKQIALIESRNTMDDGSEKRLVRYQFGNHLGSVSLETDDKAQVISYEEYHPYGTTAYQAADKNIKASAKRFRFTGKERDEESGFYYHGARYYAAWLGRWTACDPGGLKDGNNLYKYVGNNPIVYLDPNGKESWRNDLTFMQRLALSVDNVISPSTMQKISDFSAGFGDVLSFNTTNKARDAMGTNNVVNKDSSAYNHGGASGVVLQTAIGAATVPASVAQFGVKATVTGMVTGMVGLKAANVALDTIDSTQTASGVLNTAASLLIPAKLARSAPAQNMATAAKSVPTLNESVATAATVETTPPSTPPASSIGTKTSPKSIAEARKFFNLPETPTKSNKTIVGVLEAGEEQMLIQSGEHGGPWGGTQRGGVPRGEGHGFTSGGSSQGNIATHVEGHAAAIMHQRGISNATLRVESDPCQICSRDLMMALPPDSTLNVISPGEGLTIFRSSHYK